jgi:hypothetical protein
MDGLEEQRTLSDLETTFRKLVKNHLASLLESKRIYWKQRNTVRWVKLGDENTQFFHTIATINHKKNFIASLALPDGSNIIDHEQKAQHLWSSFKRRLGASEYSNMAFDLNSLLVQHDMGHLDEDFSQLEIDMVIKSLPNSHAPRLNGLNGLFIKKC